MKYFSELVFGLLPSMGFIVGFIGLVAVCAANTRAADPQGQSQWEPAQPQWNWGDQQRPAFVPVLGTNCLTQLTLTWGMHMPMGKWQLVRGSVSSTDTQTPVRANFTLSPKEREQTVCVTDVAWQGTTPLELTLDLGLRTDSDYQRITQELILSVSTPEHSAQWHFTKFIVYRATGYLSQVETVELPVDLFLTVRMATLPNEVPSSHSQ